MSLLTFLKEKNKRYCSVPHSQLAIGAECQYHLS
nr:MAG TPA: hypothetical protein [Caudoviricetes sp.]